MEKCKDTINIIVDEFKNCKNAFTALGDETRQHIIIALLESDCNGIRIGEITQKTNLSRPAVSHHLKILRNAGIINMRREGTKNYYFVDADESQWKRILNLVELVYEVSVDIKNNDPRKDEPW